jgi:hypothetical protein
MWIIGSKLSYHPPASGPFVIKCPGLWFVKNGIPVNDEIADGDFL